MTHSAEFHPADRQFTNLKFWETAGNSPCLPVEDRFPPRASGEACPRPVVRHRQIGANERPRPMLR